MALARARKFQEAKQKEDELRNIEKMFRLTIVHPGDAVNFPKKGDQIAIHYMCYLEDGTCFDNSMNRGQPLYFVFGASQVVPAIEMILPILSRGEKARIVVPHEYGYGERGYPPIVPPRATILMEIHLITFSSVGNEELLLRERRDKDPFAL